MPDPARRFEVKLPLRDVPFESVLRRVRAHPLGFHQAHPERWVNNLYFDTPDYRCYADALSGLNRKVKCRLRWYGPPEGGGRGRLEWKRRWGQLGDKRVVDVAWEGRLADLRLPDLRAALLTDLAPTARRRLLQTPTPALVNRYRRRYFVSRDRACRLTIDDALTFLPQASSSRLQLRAPTRSRLLIVELKLAADQTDCLRRALAGFSARPQACSKYSIGMGLLNR